MQERDETHASAQEQQGRQSGSLAWRVSRGEEGGTRREEEERFVWRLDAEERRNRIFQLEYDVVADRYTRPSAAEGERITQGWRRGVAEDTDIFRKKEHDWKMCYLARRGGEITVQSIYSILCCTMY